VNEAKEQRHTILTADAGADELLEPCLLRHSLELPERFLRRTSQSRTQIALCLYMLKRISTNNFNMSRNNAGHTISLVVTTSQCSHPRRISVHPMTGIVYIACENGALISFNGTSIASLIPANLCPTPTGVVASPTLPGVAYVACQNGVVMSTACAPGQVGADGVAPCTTCPSEAFA
jgi:hypothetical protein